MGDGPQIGPVCHRGPIASQEKRGSCNHVGTAGTRVVELMGPRSSGPAPAVSRDQDAARAVQGLSSGAATETAWTSTRSSRWPIAGIRSLTPRVKRLVD